MHFHFFLYSDLRRNRNSYWILYHNKKLFARSSRHNSCVWHHQQIFLPTVNSAMVEGSWGARTRYAINWTILSNNTTHFVGIPKVLVGNRLHLAFKRQVAARSAEEYASRHKMPLFEISPLCDFNIRESFCEVARLAIGRNGMERLWRTNKGTMKQSELCCS